jgi:WhiB family redox-sensing transcriptional regulator
VSYRDVRWQDDAACVGMDTNLFYPEGCGTKPSLLVLETCARCPVSGQCLDDAVAHADEHGVWGGVSARKRQHRRGEPLSELHKARIGESVRLAARRRKAGK